MAEEEKNNNSQTPDTPIVDDDVDYDGEMTEYEGDEFLYYDAGELGELECIAEAPKHNIQEPATTSEEFTVTAKAPPKDTPDTHILSFNIPQVKNQGVSIKTAVGLDNILTETVKQYFNTYNYFGIFDSFDDYYVPAYDDKGKEIFEGADVGNPKYTGVRKGIERDKVTVGSPAVRSLFNRTGQILIGNIYGADKDTEQKLYWTKMRNQASNWRIANNVPLMDSPKTRERIRKHSGCTVKELVKASSAGDLGRAIYTYADFMYCKYLGRVSNNYLITLRRFPIPPGDCITTAGVGKQRTRGRRGKESTEGESHAVESQGCLVTWLGTPGNDMSSILKYSVVMPYQEKKSQWEDIQGGDADSQTGILNSIAAGFNSSYRRAYCQGMGGNAFNSYIGGMFGLAPGPHRAQDFSSHRDRNKIYGPIDVVKKIYKRGEDGLDFNQNITITFDYELRSYNGVNPRQAMLDLIANILNVTYSSGGWWKGGYRGGGMAQSSVFTNMNIFKDFGGTFTGFCDALQKDYQTLTARLATSVQSAGGILKYCVQMLNNIGGMIMGGMLNKLGRPARTFANSLISEQPTGMWHLMIGNPHHPIMSIGNMVLKNTTIEHYGPLGLDDFPTGLRVKCELDRGKSRDNREIEKLYMNGNDRIYSSIGSKVVDMYKKAAEYKAALEKTTYFVDKTTRVINTDNAAVELQAKLDESKKQFEDAAAQAELALAGQRDNLTIIEGINKTIETEAQNVLRGVETIDTNNGFYSKCSDTSQLNKEVAAWKSANMGKSGAISRVFYNEKSKEYVVVTAGSNTAIDRTYKVDEMNPERIQFSTETELIYRVLNRHYGDDWTRENIIGANMLSENLSNAVTGTSFEENVIARDEVDGPVAEYNKYTADFEKYTSQSNFLKSEIERYDKAVKNANQIAANEKAMFALANNLNDFDPSKMNSEKQMEIMSSLYDTEWYKLMHKWFGHTTLDSISMASQEQEYGSFKKKDIELKTYDPEKKDTAESQYMMLKQKFETMHDKTTEVSINHIDGKGNIHHLNISIDLTKTADRDKFLEDYKAYLAGQKTIDDLKAYIDTEEEKKKSYVKGEGELKTGADKEFASTKAAPIPEKKSHSSSRQYVADDTSSAAGTGASVSAGVVNNSPLPPANAGTVFKSPGKTAQLQSWFGGDRSCANVKKYMTSQKFTSANGYSCTMTLHRDVMASFSAAWEDIKKYVPGFKVYYSAGWCYRKIKNSSSMSNHSWGGAMDFNPTHNGHISAGWGIKDSQTESLCYGQMTKSKAVAKTRRNDGTYKKFCPNYRVIEIMNNHGWGNGCYYTDYMHFSIFGGG